jgi:hypothetical protein
MKACKRARGGTERCVAALFASTPSRASRPQVRAPHPRPAPGDIAPPRVSPSRCGERETYERAPKAAHPRRHGALDVHGGLLLDINNLRLLRAGDAGDVAGDILNGLHGGGGHSCCGCVSVQSSSLADDSTLTRASPSACVRICAILLPLPLQCVCVHFPALSISYRISIARKLERLCARIHSLSQRAAWTSVRSAQQPRRVWLLRRWPRRSAWPLARANSTSTFSASSTVRAPHLLQRTLLLYSTSFARLSPPDPPLRLPPVALCRRDILAAKLYPFKLMFRWLSYGNGESVPLLLGWLATSLSARRALAHRRLLPLAHTHVPLARPLLARLCACSPAPQTPTPRPTPRC